MKRIEEWTETNQSFGIELPDGWFGRPYDNQHKITWAEERPNKIIIELDQQLFLIFTKPVTISKSGKNLIFSDFKQLTFDRQGYDDMTAHSKSYKTGAVTLVSVG